jgi:hypothetical protein
MRGTGVLFVLAGLGGALLPSRAIGGPVTRPSVIIRIYDSVGLASDRLTTARHAVSAVLKPAGIDITWRDCRRAGTNGSSCNGALEPTEVIIRVVNAASTTQADDRLGYSSVDVQHHYDCLATVFADRIEAMAGRTQSDQATLLGHVMAHEIGHLLMGTSTHSPIGLMRKRFSDDELRRRSQIDWQLTRSDAKNVRVGLLERAKRLGQAAAKARAGTTMTDGPFEGWTLRLTAATGWGPRGVQGKCAELETVDLPIPGNSSLAQFLRHGVKLLVRYVQLFARRGFLRRQHPVEDSIRQLKPPGVGSTPGWLFV